MSGIGDFMDRKRRFPTEAFYGLERAQFAQTSFWSVGFGPNSSESDLRPTSHSQASAAGQRSTGTIMVCILDGKVLSENPQNGQVPDKLPGIRQFPAFSWIFQHLFLIKNAFRKQKANNNFLIHLRAIAYQSYPVQMVKI